MNFHHALLRRGLLLAVLTILPLTTFAQPSAERLKQVLDLTDEQVDLVTEAIGDEAERGDLWAVAAALAPTLTDEQKAKLFARPERPAARGKMHDRRRARGDRPGRRMEDATRAERREARHEAMMADMQAALDLTDEQVQQLEAFHAERMAEREALREELREERERLREEMRERRADRPEPGELPEEVAAVLTPEQQEVARVHRALAAHAMHRVHHARRDHRR